MRWTKDHWAKLDGEERSMLMGLLRGLKRSGYSDPYLKDGLSCCGGCGEPDAICDCYELVELFTQKMGVPAPF